MRHHGLALASLPILTIALYAQQPSQPPQVPAPSQQPTAPAPLDPERNRLDYVLVQWEKSMMGLSSFSADCSRQEFEQLSQRLDKYQGRVKYLNPNFFSLEMYHS